MEPADMFRDFIMLAMPELERAAPPVETRRTPLLRGVVRARGVDVQHRPVGGHEDVGARERRRQVGRARLVGHLHQPAPHLPRLGRERIHAALEGGARDRRRATPQEPGQRVRRGGRHGPGRWLQPVHLR